MVRSIKESNTMQDKTKEERIEKLDVILVVIANTIWFGFWLIAIISLEASLWWFLFPTIFHWSVSDFNKKEETTP